MTTDVITKKCNTCQRDVPLSGFYKDNRLQSGLAGRCKKCHGLAVTEWRRLNEQKMKEWLRSYYQRPDLRARQVERRRQQKEQHPEKHLAYCAVYRARRRGDLVVEPCARCGSENYVEAHHENYSKPLQVQWLCRLCHRRVERENRASS